MIGLCHGKYFHCLPQHTRRSLAADMVGTRTADTDGQTATSFATYVRYNGRREADGQLDMPDLLGRWLLGLPQIEQDNHVAISRPFELPNHECSGPGGTSPMDLPLAVAAVPLTDSIEVAIQSHPSFAAPRFGERLTVVHDPTSRQAAQSWKHDQRFGPGERHRVTQKSEWELCGNTSRPELISTSLLQPSAVGTAS